MVSKVPSDTYILCFIFKNHLIPTLGWSESICGESFCSFIQQVKSVFHSKAPIKKQTVIEAPLHYSLGISQNIPAF